MSAVLVGMFREVSGVDLQNRMLEHAATDQETPVLTWMGC